MVFAPTKMPVCEPRICAAVIQLVIDSGVEVWIYWQIIPYVFLTLGEVLVSATG